MKFRLLALPHAPRSRHDTPTVQPKQPEIQPRSGGM